jgi:uncharacterized protein (TIGR03437 family)
MTNHTLPHLPAIAARSLSALLLVVLLLPAALLVRSGRAASRQLTLAERVAAQRAIEEVYWRQRRWPKENPQPKPAFALTDADLRAKVEDYLRRSQALAAHRRPLTAEQLQAELERMARQTRAPEVLRELWAALGNDPYLIAECLARPLLAERLSRELYAADAQHQRLRQRAEAELQGLRKGEAVSGDCRELAWKREQEQAVLCQLRQQLNTQAEERLDEMSGAAELRRAVADLPASQWSELREDEERFYAVARLRREDGQFKAARVEWRKTQFDEWWRATREEFSPDVTASAARYSLPQLAAQCSGEAWTATNLNGAPSPRNGHAAVWTGNEMIVWGGLDGPNFFNTGRRYNPATDAWTATSTTGAPSARSVPTAVWTGAEMIVWGGSAGNPVGGGGRYNPVTDNWQAVAEVAAPPARLAHTAIWTGTEMIVWGGVGGPPTVIYISGGRYTPASDSWQPTTLLTAPGPRIFHTAVWTGTDMIIWGGLHNGDTGTGSRYNAAANTWAATNLSNAPRTRFNHSAVWTGAEMIVWGGVGNANLSTGGRYSFATNQWQLTSDTNAPSPRDTHTAVWTGTEMIVWGGKVDESTALDTGARYTPASDAWTPTTQTNAPSARTGFHTAVWTGNAMIVWGGLSGTTRFNTGARYVLNASVTIAPASQAFPASGGQASVAVSAPGACAWTATSNANWLTITAGGSGSGNGAVNFTVAANGETSPRTGTLTIAGQTFTVTQAAAAVACPTVSSLNPTSGAVGASVTITGANFSGVTAVSFSNNVAAVFTVNDAGTQISTMVPTGAVNGPLTLSKTGCAGVQTPSFTVTQISNPTPSLTSLNPNAANAGSAAFALTVNGASFLNASIVQWNGANRPTTFVSATQLTAAIPASDLAAAGTANVTVVNPAPGGGASNALSFAINQPPNPQPLLMALSPSAATAGGAALTLTVNGASFINASVVRWNGDNRPTSFVSSTQLTAQLAVADIAQFGQARVVVSNPAPGGGVSAAATFNILQPITNLAPHTATAGSAAFTLTVTGRGFSNGARVRWNGSERPTTFVSETQLQAAIAAADVAAASVARIGVVSPTLSGGSANEAGFLINAPDQLAVDDGVPSADFSSGFFAAAVNRLTPTGYPATLTAISIYFPPGGVQAGDQLTLYLGVNPSGSETINGLAFQRIATQVQAAGQFNVFTVPGLTITAGDFVIGYGLNAERLGAYALDGTPPTRRRSYSSADGATFRLHDKDSDNSEGFSGNFMIRARLASPLANVSAASYQSAELAPDSIVAAFGSGLATATQVATTLPLPTTLAGTTVRVRDSAGREAPAPLFFVSPTQVNYLLPPGLASGPATVSVSSSDGTLSVGLVTLANVAPGLFSANAGGRGVAAGQVLRVKADGAQAYEPLARFDAASNQFVPEPIDLGPESEQVFLILYGTGFRQLSAASASLRLGGTDAPVVFAGAVSGLAGLDQANARIPRSLAGRGEVEIVWLVEGKMANTLRLSIK